jgi:adenine-specific DNA-methyltransferase
MARENQASETEAKSTKRPIVQYDHKGKTRANNPPVGLVTPQTDPDAEKKKTYQYDPHLDPQLVWAGKAERCSFDVPTVSLHVHERIDPRTIIRAVQKRNGEGSGGSGKLVQRSMFEEPGENPPLREAIDFYRHAHGWSNRLIAGDSLLVMNSLLEKEGMAGKVQMVYIDPPYGIRYGSNFQPFVNQRDVKDGKDEDLTQEPEMIQAFRDIWELGTHSYLTSLRDRMLLARDLLHESGSCFVQISDRNIHHVREVMDETFGPSNFAGLVTVRKTGGLGSSGLTAVADFLVWYYRDKSKAKYRKLFLEKVDSGVAEQYRNARFPDGRIISLKKGEDPPAGAFRFSPTSLHTMYAGVESCLYSFELGGKRFSLPPNRQWSTTLPNMMRLAWADRIYTGGNTPRFIRHLDDFPVSEITTLWNDMMGSDDKVYVVQTATRIVQRCMLMTTDPGDLVLDTTCGSGTTAYVAEQWGRRWITCDTSRVAITLAKQRLMTAIFDYFELARRDEGVGSGFVYRTVPHVTLKSIANNPEIREGMSRAEVDAAIAKYAERETLYDQPKVDHSTVRVTGPFTLEAVPAPAVSPVTEIVVESKPADLDVKAALPGLEQIEPQSKLEFTEDVSVARYGETLRQRQWRDELLACGIRAKGGQRIEFSRLEPLGAARWLQCDGETKPAAPSPPAPLPKGEGSRLPSPPAPLPKGDGSRLPSHQLSPEGREGTCRVVVSFGPEHAPLEQRQVALALDEAGSLRPAPKMVVFAAFQFDPEAAKDIDETKWPGVTLLKVQMNTDLLTDDLKKKRSSNESYWLMGQPDVELRQVKKGAHKGKWEVEIHGFDYFNPRTGAIESGDTSRIAMWMLDTDYDGRSLFPRQVFFPMAGPKDGWARLAKNLKAEVDEELIESYCGTVSLPFEQGDYKRAAVKIVDDRGIESLKVIAVE